MAPHSRILPSSYQCATSSADPLNTCGLSHHCSQTAHLPLPDWEAQNRADGVRTFEVRRLGAARVDLLFVWHGQSRAAAYKSKHWEEFVRTCKRRSLEVDDLTVSSGAQRHVSVVLLSRLTWFVQNVVSRSLECAVSRARESLLDTVCLLITAHPNDPSELKCAVCDADQRNLANDHSPEVLLHARKPNTTMMGSWKRLTLSNSNAGASRFQNDLCSGA